MEGESSGVQQAQDQGGQEQGVGTQQKQGQQAPQEDQVSEGDDTDYAAQLKAKDAEIEALISWLCAKRWCQRPGKGVRRPPPRIFSYHVETTGDNHVDTAAHDAHAMPPRRHADHRRGHHRLQEAGRQAGRAARARRHGDVGRRAHRGGREPERLPGARAQDRHRRDGVRGPRLREGSHFPDGVLRPYSRTDRAMAGAIAEGEGRRRGRRPWRRRCCSSWRRCGGRPGYHSADGRRGLAPTFGTQSQQDVETCRNPLRYPT